MARSCGFARVLALALLWGSGLAHAQPATTLSGSGLTSIQLARYAEQVLSSDAELRRSAANTLSHLTCDSLPALQERWSALLRQRPSHDEAVRVLLGFRRAAMAEHNDEVDLARGILPVLAQERSRTVLALAEPLLYLRAIAELDEAEGEAALQRYVGLDEGAWEDELRAYRKRKGMALLPTLLAWRAAPSSDVRHFAQAGVTALGMENPELALATSDLYLRSRIVRAYASLPDFSAMPNIVRMVGSPSTQVRQAARFTLSRYGKSAIWQVRELYEEVAGQPADKAWSFERSVSELYATLDRDRTREVQAWLAKGLQLYVAGDFGAMHKEWDALLAKYPELPERAQLAPGYAALGAERLSHDDLSAAADAYRRALRLSPDNPETKRWQAQLEYVSAELSLTQGVVDLGAYQRALSLDPSLRAAKEAKDRLSGARGRRIRQTKRWAAAFAWLVLCTLALVAVRGRGRNQLVEVAKPEST